MSTIEATICLVIVTIMFMIALSVVCIVLDEHSRKIATLHKKQRSMQGDFHSSHYRDDEASKPEDELIHLLDSQFKMKYDAVTAVQAMLRESMWADQNPAE